MNLLSTTLSTLKWGYFNPWFKLIGNEKTIKHGIGDIGGKIFDFEEINQIKGSPKLFVLGTGQSINNFTPDELKEIKRNDSIAMNHWAQRGPLVPKFYTFELENQHTEKELNRKKETINTVINNWEYYSQTIFILTPYQIKDISFSTYIKKLDLEDKLYWKTFDPIPGNTYYKFKKYLKIFHKLGILNRIKFLPNKGSSLSWIIGFAYKMGYDEIILCGIDLQGDHFYENSEPVNLAENSKKKIHLTATQNQNGRLSIQNVIRAWNDAIFKPEEISLYVSNHFSPLSEFLPVYWKNKTL